MSGADIAGYTYRADIYCPACLVEAMIHERSMAPAARGMGIEEALDQCAQAVALDRYDERSFDSGDFPKVVFVSMLEGDVCGSCGGEL